MDVARPAAEIIVVGNHAANPGMTRKNILPVPARASALTGLFE
jgi:hypothetical protein